MLLSAVVLQDLRPRHVAHNVCQELEALLPLRFIDLQMAFHGLVQQPLEKSKLMFCSFSSQYT